MRLRVPVRQAPVTWVHVYLCRRRRMQVGARERVGVRVGGVE